MTIAGLFTGAVFSLEFDFLRQDLTLKPKLALSQLGAALLPQLLEHWDYSVDIISGS